MNLAYLKQHLWALIITLFVVLLLPGRVNALDPTEFFRQGSIYLEQGKLGPAIVAFTEAIQQDALYVEAYNNRALAYYEQGNNDQAQADFLKALELDPDNEIANSNLGILLFEKGDYENALAYLERAVQGHLRCSPWDNIVYNNLAYIYSRLGMEGMVNEVKKRKSLRCPESKNSVMHGATSRRDSWFKRKFLKSNDHRLTLMVRKDGSQGDSHGTEAVKYVYSR